MNNFNFDSLASMNASLAGKSAMQAVTAIQSLPAEQQIAGLALAFVLLTEKYKIHPGNALNVIGNLLEQNRKTEHYVKAVQNYVRHEL